MDLLKGYAHSDEEMSDDDAAEPVSLENCKSLALPTSLAVAPEVNTKSILKQIAIVDPRTKELKTNPTYDQLFQPEAGPSNPFKSDNQKAQKNTLTGFVEPAHINDFHFTRELRSFDTLGYARNPTAERSNEFIGNKEAAVGSQGESLFDSKKTGGEKRKRQANFDASDVEGYTGPWAKYCDEKTIAKPDPELQKEMDEIVRKRQANSRRFKRKQQQQENDNADETSTLHLKEAQDYQGRSFLVPPAFTGVNLRADAVPEKCFIPKKQIHVYKGHTKGVNCVQWFPKSAHLFLSCSMDTKVKQRFHTGHIPFCVKFHPDDDKNHMFLAGMQNKKIVQWDSRTGEIVQEYDRHLGPVNSITFFDKNRRFASTSDDKSIRIWEWEIPVDTKLIQNVGLHSIPTMNKSPNEKWVVGQSMDNRIVLFQLIDEKLRFAKKKAFRGHNSAGYACVTDFSPDMSFLISGDADGKLFIWDWRTHKIVARWKAHDNTCISARWHPHEKSKILTAGWDSVIKMWA
ncbi:WD domain, G-beta repeat protein [Ancylostoma ceylanicum]|uniref:WD domain, G-beta repeat protein n=1 Tax=Ancylostoma ceylanicum TaxID=53326 RepID=A0A0D6LQY6_9BILA|nr:WD domain, G-beta repeat protein [Ancylostoma ceylanicum]